MDASKDLVTDNAEVCKMLGELFVSDYSVPLTNIELPSNDQ